MIVARGMREAANEWFFSHVAQQVIRVLLAMSSIFIGLVWAFGPDSRHSATIYSVWNSLGASWTITGLWAMASGLIILFAPPRARLIGYAMGFMFRATFAGYALAAFFISDSIGITGFTDWFTLALLHVVCMYAIVRGEDSEQPGEAEVKEAIVRRADG